jgi:hypothetical protein
MKLYVAACMLVFSVASLAQSAPQSNDPEMQSLIAKSRSVLEAEKAKNVDALNGLLAEDFRGIDLAGEFSGRGEFLGSAKQGFLKDYVFYEAQAFRVDNDSMLVFYNSAVTLSDAVMKELAQDNLTFPRYSKVSDLWVRQNGDWKLKFEQVTALRPMY